MSRSGLFIILFAFSPVLGRHGIGRGLLRGAIRSGSRSGESSKPDVPQPHFNTGIYPGYQGTLPPPDYVFEYYNSGNKYNELLTGLALYNLARISAHDDKNYYSKAISYKTGKYELCEFQVSSDTAMAIDCQLLSSFIVDAEKSGKIDYHDIDINPPEGEPGIDSYLDSKFKGATIEVTDSLDCHVLHFYKYKPTHDPERIRCGLLQKYTEYNLKNNNSSGNSGTPVLKIVILLFSVAYLIV